MMGRGDARRRLGRALRRLAGRLDPHRGAVAPATLLRDGERLFSRGQMDALGEIWGKR
jgi:hypothetical protein